MKINKKLIVLVTSIVISVICTWLFARHIEWGLLADALKDANYVYMIPTLFLVMSGYALRAVRWQSLMQPIKKVSFINMFSAISIGFMANHILPARLGEIIRPAFIGKKENIKITSSLATVLLERIFDLFGLLVFTVVILMFIPSPKSEKIPNVNHTDTIQEAELTEGSPDSDTEQSSVSFLESLKKWIGVFAGLAISAIIFLVLLVAYPHKTKSIFHKILSIFPDKFTLKFIEFLDSFIFGLQILGNIRHVAWVFFLTIVIWVQVAAVIYTLAFSFNLALPFNGACLVAICLAFAVALPQAPGYIGVFHLATQKSLTIFNIEMVSAQSYALSLWAVSIIPITIVGILFLWKEGIAFKDLTHMEEKP